MKSAKDKKRIASEALGDLLGRDIAKIATDPRYMRPEQGPIPIVSKISRLRRKLAEKGKSK